MSTTTGGTPTMVAGPSAGGPGAGGSRIGWALIDSWTMSRRELAHWARQPVQVVVGLAFPVMLLLMFNYLIGGGKGIQGDYAEFLVPGMFALTMVFGLDATMVAVTTDLNKGVVDRFRSMPMTNGAVLVGRSVADMLQSFASLIVMMGVGLTIGWRWHGSFAGVLGAVGLLMLLRFAMLWLGIYLAMVAGKPELVVAVQILVWPVGFLSNAFTVPQNMPDWLGAVDAPTLVAWPEFDRILPEKGHSEPFRQLVRGAEWRIMPGVGHVPMADNPALVSRTILGWAAEHSPEGPAWRASGLVRRLRLQLPWQPATSR